MKPKLSDLWRWEGELDRGPFLLWGALLFAVKYNLDRALAYFVFKQDWQLANYLRPASPGYLRLPAVDATTAEQQLALLAIALPFLYCGVALTLRRLRSLQWPLWLVVLFVVPVVKWFFFAVLAVLPRRMELPPELPGTRPPPRWLRLIPHGAVGSAALGVCASLVLALGATALSTTGLEAYGWGLFVGVPFAMGLVSVLVHGAREPRSFGACVAVAMLAVGIAGLALLALAFEGVICLLMAAPLAGALALVGAVAGYFIQAGWWRTETPRVLCAAFLAVPLVIGAEHLEQTPAPLLAVKSAVVVNAPPERVWRHVVAFSELPPPTEWLFRAGVAYPIRAEIAGRGVGAVRHCVFSTGPFVEPIEVWDEPRLLKFSVTRNPAPMQEWTPYRDVHPPHLDGFLASSGGQFLLTPLPGGRTRLEGTTWYRHHMWPVGYWQAWSDFIIHRIHLRVLEHVKALAE